MFFIEKAQAIVEIGPNNRVLSLIKVSKLGFSGILQPRGRKKGGAGGVDSRLLLGCGLFTVSSTAVDLMMIFFTNSFT